MKRTLLLTSTLWYLLLTPSVFAFSNLSTGSANVSATVPEQQFNPPTLIQPCNNCITNNPRETYSWQRPNPLPSTPLNHYDFYFDGQPFASNISDSLTTADFYFYSITRTGNTFYLSPKTNLSDGYHTWKVVAYNDNNLSSTSETWTIYIDSKNPGIMLESADTNQNLNWDSEHPSTIPSEDKRYLYVTQNPLLTGKIEAYANLKFSLLCPYNTPECQPIEQTFNYTDGKFQHRFYNLIPNKAYPVYLTSTDAASNHSTMPVFYLIYFTGGGISTITPYPTTPPLPTPAVIPPIPTPTSPIIIPPTVSEIFIPSLLIPRPPVSPTPPPKIISQPTVKKYNFMPIILILLVVGLPLHLLFSQFGFGVNFTQTPNFLFTLFYPFFRTDNLQTLPFSEIYFYNPNRLDEPLYHGISNIIGRFGTNTKKLSSKVFVTVTHPHRYFKPNLYPKESIDRLCFFPNLQDRKTIHSRLQTLALDTRSLPLLLGIITSTFALIIYPHLFFLIYLYLCLQAGFSEYLYPSFEK